MASSPAATRNTAGVLGRLGSLQTSCYQPPPISDPLSSSSLPASFCTICLEPCQLSKQDVRYEGDDGEEEAGEVTSSYVLRFFLRREAECGQRERLQRECVWGCLAVDVDLRYLCYDAYTTVCSVEVSR